MTIEYHDHPHGREVLLDVFKAGGFTQGVEVGTSLGLFAMQLHTELPGLRLTCIDPYVEQDDLYEQARKNLVPMGIVLIRKRSAEVVGSVPDRSLDFVYLDGDHRREAVEADLATWTPKVRVGGILSGDDFFRHRGVSHAVRAYVDAHPTMGPCQAIGHGTRGIFYWTVAP